MGLPQFKHSFGFLLYVSKNKENLGYEVNFSRALSLSSGRFYTYLADDDALIIESFGVGGIPSTCDNRFYALIESAISRGKTVVMTTQVENEGSDLAIYRVGHELKKRLAVLEAYDMTTEAVVTKLMWILGVTNDPDGIRNLFYQPICQDILATDYLIH